MILHLTYDEKFKLLDIDPNELHKTLSSELSMAQLRTIEDEKVCKFQNVIGHCIEIETELIPLNGDYNRASFYTSEGKIIVIKLKKFNIKTFFNVLFSILPSIGGNQFAIIYAIINVFMNLFLQTLDEDMTIVYLFLCQEYYQNGRYFDNIEIFNKVNQYLEKTQGIHWPNSKINHILLKLENIHVIECAEGIYKPKDYIYLTL